MLGPVSFKTNLAQLSPDQLQAYGPKTAGNVWNFQQLFDCPYPYRVPNFWGIAAGDLGRVQDRDLRRPFDFMTRRFKVPRVLMSRSSALDETPGENPTLFSIYDPAEPETSFRAFRETVFRVGETSEQMGVLLMPMVGSARLFADGRAGFGWDNVSFTLDTHNPFDSRQISVALTHGLGIRTVDDRNSDVIPLIVDRETGLIQSYNLGNRRFFSRHEASTSWPDDGCYYRQQRAHYIDLNTGTAEERSLRLDAPYLFRGTSFTYNGYRARIERGRYLDSGPGDLEFDRWFQSETVPDRLLLLDQFIGASPFVDSRSILNLIGAARYLSMKAGRPLQIEGAFQHRGETTPLFYQKLDVAATLQDNSDLQLEEAQFCSRHVMGCTDFNGPLVFFDGCMTVEGRQQLETIDEMFADTGYVLCSDEPQFREIVVATPHCRVRVVGSFQNPEAHAFTTIRDQITDHPSAGYAMGVLAKNMNGEEGLWTSMSELEPSQQWDGVRIWDKARVGANGREMRVQIR